MDTLEKILKQKNLILNICFTGILSLPISLGTLFYPMVSGMTSAENGVILFVGILTLFDLLYASLYLLKKYPVILLKLLRISDKRKINSAENFYFDNDYKPKGTRIIKKTDRNYICILSKNIIYKKMVCRLALVLTMTTFIIFGIL